MNSLKIAFRVFQINNKNINKNAEIHLKYIEIFKGKSFLFIEYYTMNIFIHYIILGNIINEL